KRTIPTPRPCSVVTRSSSVPGPYMSQASSWIPYCAPGDALAGAAAASASAAMKTAPTPRRMRRTVAATSVRPVLGLGARPELEHVLAAAELDGAHDVLPAVQ